MGQDTQDYLNSTGVEDTTLGFSGQSYDWAQDLEGVFVWFQYIFAWSTIGLGVPGIVSNVLTLVVYAKMGYSSNNIHISYSALAVSDLCCVVATIMCGVITLTDMFRQNNTVHVRVIDLVGAVPHLAFSRTTALLTSWISLERCLSVVFPTRYKLMVTRTVTIVAVTSISIAGFSPLVMIYITTGVYRPFEFQANTTTSADVNNKPPGLEMVQNIFIFLNGFLYPVVSSVSVTVCTAVLVVKLRQSTNKLMTFGEKAKSTDTRGKKANQNHQSHMLQVKRSTRENRITKVVVIVACVFLLCSLPMSAQLVTRLMVPGYTHGGRLVYLALMNGMVSVLMAQLNSCLNIFIFTVSGHKFRSVLFGMFPLSFCKRRAG